MLGEIGDRNRADTGPILTDELEIENADHVAVHEIEQLLEATGCGNTIGELHDDEVDRCQDIGGAGI